MTGSLCRILAYVRHHQVIDYLCLGWMVVGDLGPTHGEFSALLGWPCPVCEHRVPVREEAA